MRTLHLAAAALVTLALLASSGAHAQARFACTNGLEDRTCTTLQVNAGVAHTFEVPDPAATGGTLSVSSSYEE